MYIEGVLLRRAHAYLEHAELLQRQARSSRSALGIEELTREYQRLGALFCVEISYFERKRFINLSHELNKAMNLNSYIGLIGKSFRIVSRSEGIELCEAAEADADLTVPDAEFVIVVDADSLLMPGYASSLIRTMQSPENRRLAVAQSPYLPVPAAPGLLERTAAATTAAQWVVHLGLHNMKRSTGWAPMRCFGKRHWTRSGRRLRNAATRSASTFRTGPTLKTPSRAELPAGLCIRHRPDGVPPAGPTACVCAERDVGAGES